MNTTLLFMGIGTQEFLFLALIILLLFGGKKIPELMKGIGKGVRSFKEGMNEVEDNLKETDQKKEETTSNEKKENNCREANATNGTDFLGPPGRVA